MTKAEEKALEAIKPFIIGSGPSNFPIDAHKQEREAFIRGYEQAEKDLALTWEDIKTLFRLADNYESELNRPKYLTQEYCEEVLRRFNEQRNKQ